MKKSTQTILLTTVLAIGAITGGYICFGYILDDYALYKAESECVRNKIMSNYRRNDILTGNGTCWIRNEEVSVDFTYNR